MARPQVLQYIDQNALDIDALEAIISTLGINADNLGALVDENGKSIVSIYQSIQDISKHLVDIKSKLDGPLISVAASTRSVGSTVYLVESGIPYPFTIVEKDYTTTGNVLLMRNDRGLPGTVFDYSSSLTTYASTVIDKYLEISYTRLIRGVTFAPISISVVSSSGTESTITRRAFLPSYREVTGGNIPTDHPGEGSRFSYFATAGYPKNTTDTGINASFPLRTLHSNGRVYVLNSDGSTNINLPASNLYARPIISITSDSQVYVIDNLLATATVTE